MSWTGLANNQTISFNNLQDAVNNGFFTALASIPVSNELITKTDASTYVNCDVTFAPFAAKASNQLVVKSNLVTTTSTTTTSVPVTTTTTTTTTPTPTTTTTTSSTSSTTTSTSTSTSTSTTTSTTTTAAPTTTTTTSSSTSTTTSTSTSSTTTTTSSSSTTTTTTTQLVNCQGNVSYSGGQAYPTTIGVNMGSDTGVAILTYNAQSVPDWFILEWNSNVVVNTGYRGGSEYDYLGAQRSTFTSSLVGKTDPIYNTTYPDLTNYPDDGYPRVTSPGDGVASFNKNLASPTITTVKVYAPLGGTAWDFMLGCPGVTTTTTTTTPPTTTTTTSTSTSTTTTTTTTPPAYNYYTFTPCTGGGSIDYRSIFALGLGEVYAFQAYPPARACYTITSITASPTTNDLPTLYGPLTDCSDSNCIQL